MRYSAGFNGTMRCLATGSATHKPISALGQQTRTLSRAGDVLCNVSDEWSPRGLRKADAATGNLAPFNCLNPKEARIPSA
jgi:hypothetical protein